MCSCDVSHSTKLRQASSIWLNGMVREYVSASAITDIYYIVHRQLKDRAAAKELLKRLLMIVTVAAVSKQEIQNALDLTWSDFEDSVQYSVALLNDMNGIITRNPDDYQESKIQIWLPEQALKMFADDQD